MDAERIDDQTRGGQSYPYPGGICQCLSVLTSENGYEGPEEVLFYRTCASPGGNMGKLLTMLDVLSEHGLTSQQRSGGVCKLTLKPVQRKVNLF